MFLFKPGIGFPNLVKKFLSFLKILTKCRLNFYKVQYFQEVKCTGGDPGESFLVAFKPIS